MEIVLERRDGRNTQVDQRDELAARYMAAFIPDPGAGYALQQPHGASTAYYAKARPVTIGQVKAALSGASRTASTSTGRAPAPLSLAVVQQRGAKGQELATAAILDLDHGGREALEVTLSECQRLGLWAFAQLSTSADEGGAIRHDGGHVWIPFNAPQPASMLLDLARRLQAAAQVDGECYPTGAKLRPPLMVQLRAPGGPQRFPLLLQSGELLDPSEPWEALASLFSPSTWRPNSTAALHAALDALPGLKGPKAHTNHKSKVNPYNGQQVVTWYNESFSLLELLEDEGADTSKVSETSGGALRCPFHDDRSPSFRLWYHDSRKYLVGRCFATNCKANPGEGRFLDPFNVHCLTKGYSEPGEAVKALSEQYGLGERRRYKVQEVEEPAPIGPDALKVHFAHVEAERARLARELAQAAERRGEVTILDATMGIGKTHQGAAAALDLHAAGRAVAIAAPNKAHALGEWKRRLGPAGFVWRAKAELCTCHPRGLLARLGELGYTLPDCLDSCPYELQRLDAAGRIIVFQYNHLHLNGGDLLTGFDVVMIDESPFPSLLEACHASPGDVLRLYNQRFNAPPAGDLPDPALPLLEALATVARTTKAHFQSLRGAPLLEAISAALPRGLTLEAAIIAARRSPAAARQQLAPESALRTEDASGLVPVFFGELLDQLERAMRAPARGEGLAWGLEGAGKREGSWLWYDRHELLGAALTRLDRPAVLVLDGSANEVVDPALFAPWPIQTLAFHLPPSPAVTVVQVKGTPHTRATLQTAERVAHLAKRVAIVAHNEGVQLEGGIAFKSAVDTLSEALGGRWLHYGGQRGRNDLSDAHAIALIGSPAVPPDALERATLALFDGAPLARDAAGELWERQGAGQFRAHDPRLEAVARVHGPEEVRQAAHRLRLVLAAEPKTVLIFSPWDLTPLGLTPSKIVTELPTTHSTEGLSALAQYQKAAIPATAGLGPFFEGEAAQVAHLGHLQQGVNERPNPLGQVVNGQSCTLSPAPPLEKEPKPAVNPEWKSPLPPPAPPPWEEAPPLFDEWGEALWLPVPVEGEPRPAPAPAPVLSERAEAAIIAARPWEDALSDGERDRNRLEVIRRELARGLPGMARHAAACITSPALRQRAAAMLSEAGAP